jgi:deoxyribodipyrimidine photo-lyase
VRRLVASGCYGGAPAAEKFIQEVLWRTYWKGWLEMRPFIWTQYNAALAHGLDAVAGNGGLRRDCRAAMEGKTGIEGFDDWARELVDTGYLHNHARMWFASIWIFTLRLPWELGADFFLRHLLDGDAASNTLSWRWVAGLQTRGKTYAASRDNIHTYTAGRFKPDGLASHIQALEEPTPAAARALPARAAQFDGPCAVLLTPEDYGVETLPLDWSKVRAASVADLTGSRTERGVSEAVSRFGDAAARDTIQRLKVLAPSCDVLAEPMVRLSGGDVASWLRKHAMKTLVVPETPVGPAADAMAAVGPVLAREQIELVRVRRPWDTAAWPCATKGFFPFKEQIPDLLRQEGLM